MILLNSLFIKAFSVNEQLVMIQLLLKADDKGVVEFSDRGISRSTGIPYQQVRTIHQKLLSDGTLTNAPTNAGDNAKRCFVTICDYDSYNIINIISNAVNNAVANALKEKEITKEKEEVSPQTPLPTEKENNKEKEQEEKPSIEGKKKKVVYSDEFESDWILYGRKGSKVDGYKRWKQLTEDDKVKMRKHIPYYLQSRDLQYLKDFEGYINQRLFESPVYKGNVLLYDPMKADNQAENTSEGYDMHEEYGYFLQGIDQHYGILDNLVMPTYDEYLEMVKMVTLGKLEFSLSQIGHSRYADGTSLYGLFKERFGNG